MGIVSHGVLVSIASNNHTSSCRFLAGIVHDAAEVSGERVDFLHAGSIDNFINDDWVQGMAVVLGEFFGEDIGGGEFNFTGQVGLGVGRHSCRLVSTTGQVGEAHTIGVFQEGREGVSGDDVDDNVSSLGNAEGTLSEAEIVLPVDFLVDVPLQALQGGDLALKGIEVSVDEVFLLLVNGVGVLGNLGINIISLNLSRSEIASHSFNLGFEAGASDSEDVGLTLEVVDDILKLGDGILIVEDSLVVLSNGGKTGGDFGLEESSSLSSSSKLLFEFRDFSIDGDKLDIVAVDDISLCLGSLPVVEDILLIAGNFGLIGGNLTINLVVLLINFVQLATEISQLGLQCFQSKGILSSVQGVIFLLKTGDFSGGSVDHDLELAHCKVLDLDGTSDLA